MALELVQQPLRDAAPIEIGNGFRHFSVMVPSIEGALQRAMDRGCEIVEGAAWEAGEVYIRVRCNTIICVSQYALSCK
jgi:aspartate ammonia-lyase